ncbi:MAG: histidinol dehydrogenase [Proteobacteria bacterium]|nr:MAG: histidinol dehydrogenase [Pseudomonadota bacterium]
MRILEWQTLSEESRQETLSRPKAAENQAQEVRQILAAVKTEGDLALRNYSKKFDGCDIQNFLIGEADLKEAELALDTSSLNAFDQAIGNIDTYHRSQLRGASLCQLGEGHVISRETRPIERVGFYIPGGSAVLVSTLMMLAVPAKIAGCDSIVVCTPPDRFGNISPLLLGLLAKLGINQVFRIGGAQAIAAMAYGTATVPKVDKIFGPGNSWVTTAKMLVAEDADGSSIDMPAGPSELMLLADASSNPEFVAADLLSQAEHGADSQVILLSLDRSFVAKVMLEIKRLLKALPRIDLILKSLEHGAAILVKDQAEAVDIINRYAPEHLSLQVADFSNYLPLIQNAAAIFCGPWTPESAGDYATGANHVLPTGAWARSLGGLSVDSFQKTLSIQTLSSSALARLSSTIERLSSMEGLAAHGLAVSLRMKNLLENSDGQEVENA